MFHINLHKKIVYNSYVGDFTPEDMNSPTKAKKALYIAKKQLAAQKRKIDILRIENARCKKQVTSLSSLIDELKEKTNLSDEVCHVLEVILKTLFYYSFVLDFINKCLISVCFFQASLPGPSKELVKRALSGKEKGRYSPELRTFALTLQFYSSKAYNYVRDTFDLALPHEVTLRKWYNAVDGSPGFTSGAVTALKAKVAKASEKGQKVYCAMMVDEIAIKQHIEWDGKKFHGYIDFGTDLDNDQLPVAKEAWVFMLSAINGHWKIPIGYFLINGLGASERANFINVALDYVADIGLEVVSLTFDGASCNLTMAHILGANLDINSEGFQHYFFHKGTGKKIYIILDVCHMLKLVRNTLASRQRILDSKASVINWDYIVKLQEVQVKEGLFAATKLRARHVQWEREKMKVKLAAQTLSNSVATALEYLEKDRCDPEFLGAEATVKFLKIFDGLFDVLNSRNLLSKGLKSPLSVENFSGVFQFLKEAETYIKSLSQPNGVKILESNRKSGFLGFLVTIRSVLSLYTDLIETEKLKFLLTYKFSQDHLEMFFSCIRSKGGFNNNPTAKQFAAAYKRLLVHHQVTSSTFANCIPLDETTVLNASSANVSDVVNTDLFMESSEHLPENEHLYAVTASSLQNTFTGYVTDIVEYISGFVVKKITKKLHCKVCVECLHASGNEHYAFISRKNLGRLVIPSQDVVKVCKCAESHIRLVEARGELTRKDLVNGIVIKCLRDLQQQNIFCNLMPHILQQEPLSNHRYYLLKLILVTYVNVRLRHIAKEVTAVLQNNKIRSLSNKLVHFKGH